MQKKETEESDAAIKENEGLIMCTIALQAAELERVADTKRIK